MRNVHVGLGDLSAKGSKNGWRKAGALLLLAILATFAWQLASWGHSPVHNAAAIPAGTVLPVRLEDTVAIRAAQPKQPLEAKIMQDVPLPDRGKIPAKSEVHGSIISVAEDPDGGGTKVTLKFGEIEVRKETLKVITSLRAMASFNAVRAAQTPLTGAGAGSPSGWEDTVQIGGDIRFGDGGAVRNRAKENVGQGVIGGVLVHVRANPALGCDGAQQGEDRPQALWVFSADACGVYDLKGIKIARTGKGEPVGEITLHFEKGDAKLEAGTGLLLRVVAQP